MKRHDNQYEEELQRNIDEQERAMSELLVRVMARPLTPLHKTIEELHAHIAKVQEASVKAALSVEAGLVDALDGQGKRMNRHANDVSDGLEQLKEDLAGLASALDKDRTARMEHDAATAAVLAQLDAGLAALRTQEQASAGAVDRQLTELAQGLERQQTGLHERLDAVRHALAPQIDTLAATVERSSREIARQYASLPESQKVLVAATVQEQLALQLAPFQARIKWLVAVCGLSFASTLALLGVRLIG